MSAHPPVVQTFNWRLVFVVLAILAVLVAALYSFFVSDAEPLTAIGITDVGLGFFFFSRL